MISSSQALLGIGIPPSEPLKQSATAAARPGSRAGRPPATRHASRVAASARGGQGTRPAGPEAARAATLAGEVPGQFLYNIWLIYKH